MWTKMQSYRGGPFLQDGTARIRLWHIPPTPQMSLGAKNVATADGYIDSFPLNHGRSLYGMSEVESQSDSLWSWSYKNLQRR